MRQHGRKQAASPASIFSPILARLRQSGATSKVNSFSTPYQRLDFLRPWQQLVGERKGFRPLIVIAYDRERRPLLLLPLALHRAPGIRIACFMGGKHTTFNMALWDRDFAEGATRADLDALISAIRARSEG